MAKTVSHYNAKILFGNEDLLLATQSKSFSQMIFELLSEQTPTTDQLKIFDLILSISIDHGPDTPSASKTIATAKTEAPISNAVAEGVKEINNIHGGAIEPAMSMFYSFEKEKLETKIIVKKNLENNVRLPGYGHRLYKNIDPRAELLMEQLEKIENSNYTKIARDIEKELYTQKNMKLPLNIDGAIAVVLCSFGWPAQLGKAVFIIARTPGLCGHYLNETLATK